MNSNNSNNNGGTTDYYQLDPQWEQVQDIIESRQMNFSQGNILKAALCFNTKRHDGTNYERELNKIIWFAQRELQRIQTPKSQIAKDIEYASIPDFEDHDIGC